jgi:outer membrane protein TolC
MKATRSTILGVTALLITGGCKSWFINRTDGDVHQLITNRQQAALGAKSDVHIGPESGELGPVDRMYSLNPHPVDSVVPDAFRKPRENLQPSTSEPEGAAGDAQSSPAEQEMSPGIFRDDEQPNVTVLGLGDALVYAMRHARDLQDAKEDLYLAALDLTLERHLWTPQFVADAQAAYDNFPDGGEVDRAMTAVSEAAVTQRLPFGGNVSAKVVHSLVREVGKLVSKGESGQAILAADIPILRGAGRAAYESRYVAERELIYAVRRFERFRRTFLVGVAAECFNLQQLKAAINNTYKSYLGRKEDSEKAEFEHAIGRRDIFEASRAKAILRNAEVGLVSAKERYESALDRFKILIGMPVERLLDVVEQDRDEESAALDALLQQVDEGVAVDVALRYRLDLLNSADQVDDAQRKARVAKNRILPDLDLSGSVTWDSNPDQLRAANLREEQAAWHGGIRMKLDDRKTERNAYRQALVVVRQAERNHEQFVDTVRADVRRALRRMAQQENVLVIQDINVRENELRLEAARVQFDLGRRTNQDVVDAESDLLAARNDYSAAVAAYRVAILEFRRDTGTLRVGDDGRWETPASTGNPPDTTPQP